MKHQTMWSNINKKCIQIVAFKIETDVVKIEVFDKIKMNSESRIDIAIALWQVTARSSTYRD